MKRIGFEANDYRVFDDASESFVCGVIVALKSEDSMRYCEPLELKYRTMEILKSEGWLEEDVEYWVEFLKDYIK